MLRAFADRVKQSADHVALQVTRCSKVLTWTYQQYYNECLYFASALVELHATERSCINVIGFNSPEWIISFMGITRMY